MLRLYSLHFSPLCSSRTPRRPRPRHPPPNPSPHPRLLLRFRTSRRQDTQYLQTLGIDTSRSASAEELDHILQLVDYLKSKGFSNSDIPRLAFLCPQIFSSNFSAASIDLVFSFLATDISASPEQACGLVVRCPELLALNVAFRLRPTAELLKELGVKNLNLPTTLNAHLLNTPSERLVLTIRFLRSLGFSHEDSAQICARFPAIFGYSLEDNLRPKVEYLVGEMGRSIEDLRKFPQYFAFSLEKRIAPRHLHLKSRNVRTPLPKMLLLSDAKFYEKWK